MSADMPRKPMSSWLEQAWLVRYLDRLLDDDEIAWFEAYLIDQPRLIEQVEIDTELRDAFDGLSNQSIPGIAEDSVPYSAPSFPVGDSPSGHAVTGRARRVLTRRRSGRRWPSVAAGLVVGIGLTWLAMVDRSTSITDFEMVANPGRIVFDSLRGQVAPPHVEMGDPAAGLVLLEILIPAGASSVSAQIADAPPVPLTASVDGFAMLILPRDHGAEEIQLRYVLPGSEHVERAVLPLRTQAR